jgi:toxin HigB-1
MLYQSGKVKDVEVAFENAKLQKVCSSGPLMIKTFGPECAKRLRIRLAALQSVDNVAELFELPGRWHPLRANLGGTVSGDLTHPLRLLIKPTDASDNSKSVEWANVTSVTIIGIEDTHEG